MAQANKTRDEIREMTPHLDATKLADYLTSLAVTLTDISAGVYLDSTTDRDLTRISAEVSRTRRDVYHALWVAGGGWRDAAEKLVLK